MDHGTHPHILFLQSKLICDQTIAFNVGEDGLQVEFIQKPSLSEYTELWNHRGGNIWFYWGREGSKYREF